MTNSFTLAAGMHADAYHEVVEGWAKAGTILPEQAHALWQEGRRRENVDPYEGTYMDGAPADAWEGVWRGRVWVVNVYRLERVFGGPEEGGWWTTVKFPEGIVAGPFASVSEADEVAQHMQAFASLRDVGDMYSVLGGHQFMVIAESGVPHAPVPVVYC